MKNKLVRAAVSAVLAFVLWLFVVTTYRTEAEMTFNVPVILDGESVLEDRGLMLVGDKELMVQLKLNGNRAELNKLRGSDIIVIVDLTRIYEAGEKSLEYSVSFPGDIRNGAIEVVNRKPSYITLQVAQYADKEIPLVAEVVGKPAENYEINHANITLNGNAGGAIRIGGPKNIIDNIAMAKVQINAQGVSQDISEEVEVLLCDAAGKRLGGDLSQVTVSQKWVKVFAPVLEKRSFPLEGIVTPGNGLTGADVQLELATGAVTLIGRPSALDKVPNPLPVKTFDLSQATQSTTETFEIDLSAYPGVQMSSEGPDKVVATLTLPEWTTKTVDIVLTRDNIINVDPNKKVTFGNSETAELEVSVEGWAPLLARINAEDIQVVIDAKLNQPMTYDATVTVSDEFKDGVRVVGEYKVALVIRGGSV